MAEPIRPEDVADVKRQVIPDVVIEAFNKLIALNFTGGRATVKQDDVISAIVNNSTLSRQELFDKGYLNVEEVFRRAGWKVSYTKPDCTEQFPSYFEFRK